VLYRTKERNGLQIWTEALQEAKHNKKQTWDALVKERGKTVLDIKREGRSEKVVQGKERTVRRDLLQD